MAWALTAVCVLAADATPQTIITETQELVTSPPLTVDVTFGSRVAIDAVAGVAAVRAANFNGSTGAVYVFRNFGGTWLQEDLLIGQGPTEAFGICAVSGDVIAVGVPNRANGMGASDPGAVDIFRFDGVSWELETTLTQPPGGAEDLGEVVAMHDDLLIFSDTEQLVGPTSWGAVYVYRDHGPGVWTLEATLTSTAAGGGNDFGRKISTDGQVIAIGEVGMVHVFRLVAGSWVLDAALTPAVADNTFGHGVAILGDVLAVGNNVVGTSLGRVTVYRFDGVTWIEEADFPGNPPNSGFGSSLAMGQDVLYSGQSDSSGGFVRVFRRAGGVWSETETLMSSVSGPTSANIAASGNTVLMGEPSTVTAGGVDTGAAYLFELGAPPPPQFRRGDANDDGSFNIADAVSALSGLFGPDAVECDDSADANDDGAFDIADAVSMLTALFIAGAPSPPAPHPGCGTDPTPDGLDCVGFASCP